ncbi:MAG: hypothetical protein ACLFQA_08385 [Bacteroidales bacterium]
MNKTLGSQNKTQIKSKKKKLFQPPWKYSEGFIIAFILLLTGFIIEIITPQPGISIPAFPFNMYALMAFITTLVFLHIFYRDEYFVRWLSTIPAATSSIVLITTLTILMGVFNQENPDSDGFPAAIGLTHVKNSWVFLMAQLYVLTSLGLAVIHRSVPLKKKNFGFILNHAGLWIVIAAASLGTGDLRRLRMELHQDEPVWHAYDNNGQVQQLPFALELINFDIEEYPPQLAIADSHTGRLSDPEQRPLPYIEKGTITTLLDWTITVDEFIPMAMEDEGGFSYSEETGAPPVAKVRAVNDRTGESQEGWISCGSFMYDALYLFLDGKNVLVMTMPEPKKYQSHVIARTMNDEPRDLYIEVNKPPKVKGWRLYQLSYNQNMGKWSDLSVIEVVKDPWLPLVYAGFIMLFAGAVYIFWIGKELKEEE